MKIPMLGLVVNRAGSGDDQGYYGYHGYGYGYGYGYGSGTDTARRTAGGRRSRPTTNARRPPAGDGDDSGEDNDAARC